MKNAFKLFIMLCIGLSMVSCVKLQRKASTKFKKELRADGGTWEITKENAFYIDNGNDLVYETYDGVIGRYYFGKDEGVNGLPSTEAGWWTPTNGSTEDIIYRVSTDDNDDVSITLVTFIQENGSWEPLEQFNALPGHTSSNMVWTNNTSIYAPFGLPDTIKTSTFYAKNIGN